jgi:hypothetical protein
MPFVLLVLVLLGGGLICLLVINTTLGATSFRISQLQSTSAALATQKQALQQQVAAEESPAQIARRAYELGMRVQSNGNILDLGTHRFYRLPGQAGAVTPLGGSSTAYRAAARTGAGRQPPKTGTRKTGTGKAGTGKTGTGKTGKPSRRSGSRR